MVANVYHSPSSPKPTRHLTLPYPFPPLSPQSMVANVYHSPSGPKAARRLASRIVLMACTYCTLAALATLSLRAHLPRVFTRDAAILALVRSADIPAAIMMALAWNNCLEGCLLGERSSCSG